jgi:GNAT superfamily N-acetyltransferase
LARKTRTFLFFAQQITCLQSSAYEGMAHDRSRRRGAVLVRDEQDCIPLGRILSERELLYLLTPAAVPLPPWPADPPEDPFETFGRALARHHRWVRHVPYTLRDGITDYHTAHIGFAKVIIFVISGPPRAGQPSQVELIESAKGTAGHRPQIILACCSLDELGPIENKFATIIEISDYSRSELESAADLLFGGEGTGAIATPRAATSVRRQWVVEPWQIFTDMSAMYNLWRECLPDQFQLDQVALQAILSDNGYCQNCVVRDPATRQLLGFCSTFVTYLHTDKSCLGSLAAIMVKPSHRGQGIGTSLHMYALGLLKKNSVVRIQLGSTYPRLLYGLPMDSALENWFKRFGWRFDRGVPGAGQEACDWLLDMNEWNTEGLSASGLRFRLLEFGASQREYDLAMEFVARESVRKDNMGFFSLYGSLQHTPHMGDIVMGFEGDVLVATAIVYTPRGGSPVSEELPWAGAIGQDVGGVAGICITGGFSAATLHLSAG